MTTLVSSKSQARLATFAAGFSQRIEQRIAQVEQKGRDRLKQEAAERARREKERAQQEERERRLKSERISLARVGLERLIAVGKSKPMQRMVSVAERIHPGNGVRFYGADRYVGDAWFSWQNRDDEKTMSLGGICALHLSFFQDYLYLEYGDDIPGSAWLGTTWKLFYSPESESVWRGGSEGEEDRRRSFDDFLTTIATVEPSNLALVRRYDQRSYEWEPQDIAFQFLVSCARQAQFEKYLNQCLKELEKSMRT